jgi:hypothetical protein
MAAGTLVSVNEYLSSSYDPDCDYVDGEGLERNLGEYDHAKLQKKVILCFGNLESAMEIRNHLLEARDGAPAGVKKEAHNPSQRLWALREESFDCPAVNGCVHCGRSCLRIHLRCVRRHCC